MAETDGARLLVAMPALNEAATVADVVARVPRDIPGVREVLILVVDDGSTDRTAELARGAGALVVSHGRNRGVGAAMQTAVDEAVRHQVDVMVNIDSDGQFNPDDIPTVIGPILRDEAEFVTASRFADKALTPTMPVVKRFGNWGMARLVSGIVGQRFDDVSCGFRAYSRETLLKLVLTGSFTYTQESFLLLAQRGVHMVEVPVKVRGVREHGKSRVASNVLNYGMRTSRIIFTVIRDYSPEVLFHPVAGLLALLALGFGVFFFGHYAFRGQFSPHLWSGFLAAFLFGLAVMVFALGQVAVMISRVRTMHERELYILRRYIDRHDEDAL